MLLHLILAFALRALSIHITLSHDSYFLHFGLWNDFWNLTLSDLLQNIAHRKFPYVFQSLINSLRKLSVHSPQSPVIVCVLGSCPTVPGASSQCVAGHENSCVQSLCPSAWSCLPALDCSCCFYPEHYKSSSWCVRDCKSILL